MLRRTITIIAVLGLLIAMMALPAAASSGSMNCQTGGYPRTVGYGAGLQYHWVQGTPGTYYDSDGTLVLTWTWRTGYRSWIVNAPGGGYGACKT
ncbi:MAG: hypothetical protein GXP34_07995 [Actinobacteria bacterium]|nr:hypothetical protein [Actinomycetota bacterium]